MDCQVCKNVRLVACQECGGERACNACSRNGYIPCKQCPILKKMDYARSEQGQNEALRELKSSTGNAVAVFIVVGVIILLLVIAFGSK